MWVQICCSSKHLNNSGRLDPSGLWCQGQNPNVAMLWATANLNPHLLYIYYTNAPHHDVKLLGIISLACIKLSGSVRHIAALIRTVGPERIDFHGLKRKNINFWTCSDIPFNDKVQELSNHPYLSKIHLHLAEIWVMWHSVLGHVSAKYWWILLQYGSF